MTWFDTLLTRTFDDQVCGPQVRPTPPTPATNLAECSVVHELREARRRFAESNEDTQILPTIPVPKGLDQVMGSRAPQDDEPPNAPVVTDPTAADAPAARADASKERS